MELISVILIFMLLVNNSLSEKREEDQLPKGNLAKESRRNLDDQDNYILVYFGDIFVGNIINFKNYDSHNSISNIYLDDSTSPLSDISSISLGSKLKIEFNTPPTTIANFFNGMNYIKSIDFSHFNSAEVTDMSYLLSGCSFLQTITFGDNFDTSKVTIMTNMFYSCKGLSSIDLSTFNTELVTEMNKMFYGCFSLIYLDISNFDMTEVANAGNNAYEDIFGEVTNLEYINLYCVA